MASKQFSRITVDNAGRKSAHFDLGGHLSTSLQFGEVCAAHCRKLVANSSHQVNVRSLVRLDPMVAPTSQGAITVKMWHSFIGMSDLFRHFAAFQTGKPISGSNGLINFAKLPSIRHVDLSLYCLVGAQITPYIYEQSGSTTDITGWRRYEDTNNGRTAAQGLYNKLSSAGWGISSTSTPGAGFDEYFPDFIVDKYQYKVDIDMLGIVPTGIGKHWLPLGNKGFGDWAYKALFFGAKVDIAHCDFVFYHQFVDPTDSQHIIQMAYAVNMSNYGARIYDLLNVLGIGVDFASTDEVDISRLFAYYMAYNGSFGLFQYTNYESSNCNQFLKAYENGGNAFQPIDWAENPSHVFGQADYLNLVFCHFMTDLATGYVTEPVDYISSHRRTDVICNDELGWVQNIVVATPNTAYQDGAFGQTNTTYPAGVKASTNAIYINRQDHTQVDADLLKLLYKSVNRQTIAGQELEKLLRAGGYGSYVDEQQSHFLGYTEYDVDIMDINATSDSYNASTKKSSTLGQYVGKGVGSSHKEGTNAEKTITYSTTEPGYWITLVAIVPDSSYCQGNDQTVYDTERTDQYQLEMDSMGYELQRRAVLKSGADVLDAGVTSASDTSFGYVPRLMRYKVGRSVLAGNFRRRSTRDQYLPFVLSRWLDLDDAYEAKARDTSSADATLIYLSPTQKLVDTPIAGNAWRYINLYPWLANFERIFVFDEKVRGAWVNAVAFNWYVYCGERFDYFQLYANILHSCEAPMLAVADSYSTTDDNDGKGTTMIKS